MCLNAFYDLMIENDTFRGPYKGPELTDECKDSEEPTPGCYEEKIFEDRSLEIIRNHDASDVEHPLFLFHAFHLLHTPLQVPNYYFQQINKTVVEQGGKAFDSKNRQLVMAMTHYLDDTIRNLTDALKEKDMWENTLLVFTTDNGGPIYEPGAANNYPLRGGKYSDFEGGVRTNTFISGGYVPEASRGQIHNNVVSISDWYTIFSELAGVDPEDTKAQEANKWLIQHGLATLPPIDGQKGMLEHIFQGTKGRNGSLLISSSCLMDFPYKLVTGKQPYMVHLGPLYPNCSTVSSLKEGHGPDFVDFALFGYKPDLGDEAYWRGDCGHGCLFDVERDPTEENDLSGNPDFTERLENMMKELAVHNGTLFLPGRGETHLSACQSAMYNGGGHFGPFAFIDGYYTDKPRQDKDLTFHEKLQMEAMKLVSKEFVQKAAQTVAVPVFKKASRTFDMCCEIEPGNCKKAAHEHVDDAPALAFLKHLEESPQDVVLAKLVI